MLIQKKEPIIWAQYVNKVLRSEGKEARRYTKRGIKALIALAPLLGFKITKDHSNPN